MATHDERSVRKAFANMLHKHIPRGQRDGLAGQIGEVTGKAIGHWLTGRSLPERGQLEAVITHQRVPDGEAAALRRAWADCHVDVADVFHEARAAADDRHREDERRIRSLEQALADALAGRDPVAQGTRFADALILGLLRDHDRAHGPGLAQSMVLVLHRAVAETTHADVTDALRALGSPDHDRARTVGELFGRTARLAGPAD
jgi:hypothetical protein